MLLDTDQLPFFYFQTDDSFLTSKTITVVASEAITDDNWPTLVSITFDTHCLVSGAKFDNSDMIKKFTISYTLNGKNIVYKDNHSEEEATVSFSLRYYYSWLKQCAKVSDIDSITLTVGEMVMHTLKLFQ